MDQDLGFITKGLSATGMATFYNRVYSAVYRSFTPFLYKLTDYSIDDAGNYSYVSESANTGTTYLGTSRGKDGYRELAFQVKLDYNRTFNEKHDVGATLVYHQKERMMHISDSEEYAVLPYRQQGLAGRVTYGFDKRYLVEANFGYNGSENFAPGKRFGFFPSVAAGWVVSNEPFWRAIKDKVNLLKFRVSYGLVGNDVISSEYADRFPYLTTVDMDQGYDVYIGTNHIRKYGPILSVYGNPDATWEESRKLDVGVEIGLFDSLNIIFDWFKEKRSGIFMQRASLPSSFGMSNITPWANIGKVDNRGVDISIDYNKAFSKDLILSLRGSFTYAHNEVVEMDEPAYKWDYLSKVGHPINSINCLIAEGLFQDEEEIASSPEQTFDEKLQPGDLKYADLNNDGLIDSNDQKVIGNSSPRFDYSVSINLRYRNFDFTIVGTGRASYDTALTNKYFWNGWSTGTYSHFVRDNIGGDYPRLAYVKSNNNFQNSSFWLRDGGYFKIQNVELGYNLRFRSQSVFKGLRVFLRGANLCTISGIKDVDPENINAGVTTYPLYRTFTAGFKFTF